jgi:hypothetical protein
MRIVRVHFTACEKAWCIDNEFDDTLSNQANCDNAIKRIMDAMHHEEILAVVTDTKQPMPALLNLRRVPEVIFINVTIGDITPQKEKENEDK